MDQLETCLEGNTYLLEYQTHGYKQDISTSLNKNIGEVEESSILSVYQIQWSSYMSFGLKFKGYI